MLMRVSENTNQFKKYLSIGSRIYSGGSRSWFLKEMYMLMRVSENTNHRNDRFQRHRRVEVLGQSKMPWPWT